MMRTILAFLILTGLAAAAPRELPGSVTSR